MNFKDRSEGVQESPPQRRKDHRETALSTHHTPQSPRRKVRRNLEPTELNEAATSATYAANCCVASVPIYCQCCNCGPLPHISAVPAVGERATVRDKWVVSAEGKGLDWVLEVHVGGDRKKDAERNVARYARLGIPEYFLYDGASNRLTAYRLATPEAKV